LTHLGHDDWQKQQSGKLSELALAQAEGETPNEGGCVDHLNDQRGGSERNHHLRCNRESNHLQAVTSRVLGTSNELEHSKDATDRRYRALISDTGGKFCRRAPPTSRKGQVVVNLARARKVGEHARRGKAARSQTSLQRKKRRSRRGVVPCLLGLRVGKSEGFIARREGNPGWEAEQAGSASWRVFHFKCYVWGAT